MPAISIFEIIKIGIGPSSSHTMGPWNAATEFIRQIKQQNALAQVSEVFCEFFGSLGKTGIGHGTDIAAMMGLSGEDFHTIDTSTIEDKATQIKTQQYLYLNGEKKIPFLYGEHLRLNDHKALDFHPNGMIFRAQFSDGSTITQDYYSIGGGFIVTQETEKKVLADPRKVPYPCNYARDVLHYVQELGLKNISDLVLENECFFRSKKATRQQALHIWEEIQDCIYRGVHKSGILPGGLNVARNAYDINRRLLENHAYHSRSEWFAHIKNERHFARINQWISCFALSVNEENASFGRIITAPTNGSSGVIPATLMYLHCFTEHQSEEVLIRFILVAGIVGILFKRNATISAAKGGCQAEIGVSSAMAAAGLTEALGGTPQQAFQAAEIAMEHHLGMTCDPIGGLVQIPCIQRNAMGAMKAITAAHLALSSEYEKARVSLDEVINAMWQTALDMDIKYRETSEGGLAKAVHIPQC